MAQSPCCPNHGCELDRTGTPGRGICPISGCHFEYDDTERGMEAVIGLDGMLHRVTLVTPIDAPAGGGDP